MKNKDLTYSNAGVNIDRGNELINRIKKLKGVHRPEIISGIGGFAGAFAIPTNYKEPVFLSSTDGVGTKLKIAFMANKHDTIGQDLVAMSVNDILAMGGEPIIFLDYFATSRLDIDVTESVIKGISQACEMAGCALLGGETAELPDFYKENEYDLAGFCVGITEKSLIPKAFKIKRGDIVIGIPSSGFHSNGYSLVRKVIFEVLSLKIDDTFPQDPKKRKVFEVLLEPTRIYVKEVLPLIHKGIVKGMVHVTGGGLKENPPRVLPKGLGMDLFKGAWQEPNEFKVMRQAGVSDEEMFRTFNLGLGFLIIVPKEHQDIALELLKQNGCQDARVVGKIVSRSHEGNYTNII